MPSPPHVPHGASSSPPHIPQYVAPLPVHTPQMIQSSPPHVEQGTASIPNKYPVVSSTSWLWSRYTGKPLGSAGTGWLDVSSPPTALIAAISAPESLVISDAPASWPCAIGMTDKAIENIMAIANTFAKPALQFPENNFDIFQTLLFPDARHLSAMGRLYSVKRYVGICINI
jgi:hypothetical protein